MNHLLHRFLILECNRLKGDIGQYESNYNYQLKRVLEKMNIKSMEVGRADSIETGTFSSKDSVEGLLCPSEQNQNTH